MNLEVKTLVSMLLAKKKKNINKLTHSRCRGLMIFFLLAELVNSRVYFVKEVAARVPRRTRAAHKVGNITQWPHVYAVCSEHLQERRCIR